MSTVTVSHTSLHLYGGREKERSVRSLFDIVRFWLFHFFRFQFLNCQSMQIWPRYGPRVQCGETHSMYNPIFGELQDQWPETDANSFLEWIEHYSISTSVRTSFHFSKKTTISRILFSIYIQSIWNCNCAHKCRNSKENHPILRTKDRHNSNCVGGANRIEVIVLGRNYLQAILFEWDNYCCLLNHSIVGARICECQLSMK